MFSLKILALRTTATAGTSNYPDHRLETVLDWGEVHADPLYPGHFGHQLRELSELREGEKGNLGESYHAGQAS